MSSKHQKKQKPSSKPLTVLLTGFDAFGEATYNPAQLVVETFPDVLGDTVSSNATAKETVTVRKQILPTAGARGWKTLKKALNKTLEQSDGPVVIVMLGLAAGRKSINLERFALNFRDYTLADNDGAQNREETIKSGAPKLLKTNLPLRKIQEKMNAAGYPCEVSNHAGTFICNELYFRALRYMRKSRRIEAVLFVHLPRENDFAKTALQAVSDQTPTDVTSALQGITRAGRTRKVRLLQQAVSTLTNAVCAEVA